VSVPPLAYFWGEDAFGIENAARAYAADLASEAGQPLDVWRTNVDEGDADEGTGAGGGASTSAGGGASRRRVRILGELEQRSSSGTLFGGGTLAVVRQPAALIREQTSRDQLVAIIDRVAPGNAICFVDLIASGGKAPAQGGALRDEVAMRQGRVQEFAAPTRERMEQWISTRARELGTTLAPGAAQLLAERVGAYVRESDIDRRRQTELANAELEKLALYRPDTPIKREDVDALVAEAVPGSTWAFLDAIGARRASEAGTLVRRLLDAATPMPVLITQLHRRLRDLVVVRDLLSAGTKPPDLVRELKLQPFRAQKLSEQARAWQPEELDQAFDDLYALDLLSKGIADDGSPHSLSDDRSELALLAWIGKHVGRAGGVTRPTASGRSAPVGTRR
jgi:DNA polymerase III delta subunit